MNSQTVKSSVLSESLAKLNQSADRSGMGVDVEGKGFDHALSREVSGAPPAETVPSTFGQGESRVDSSAEPVAQHEQQQHAEANVQDEQAFNAEQASVAQSPTQTPKDQHVKQAQQSEQVQKISDVIKTVTPEKAALQQEMAARIRNAVKSGHVKPEILAMMQKVKSNPQLMVQLQSHVKPGGNQQQVAPHQLFQHIMQQQGRVHQKAPMMQGQVQLHQSQGSQQIAEQINIMVNKNIQVAHLRLDPPDMGTILVRIQMNQDQPNISFHSVHQDVRHALQDQSSRLRDMLANEGLELAEFDVSGGESSPDEQPHGDFAQGGEWQEMGLTEGDEMILHRMAYGFPHLNVRV